MPLNTTLSLLLMHDRKDSYDAEGWLDEVRIHNRALSALEIMRLHSQRQAPIIVSDPESQIQSQGATVSFRVIAIGEFPLSYQWYFNGTKLAGQTGSALTLSSVQPSQGGKYFAEVRNTVGSVFSATADLAVLDASIGDATRITYSPLPPKEVGRDSLVLVTHGWQPFSNPTWVDDMVAILREKLLMKPNWQVLPYDWRNDARGLDPIKAANHAEMHGRSAGTDISTQGWAHVHLIAHSAGSSLIEAAAEKIRAISSGTTIHTTFLDPFVANGGRTKFGVHSDWSDCYFSHDNPASIVCNLIRLETLRLSAPLTEGPLMNSYNVEVSALDPCAQSVLSSDLKFEVLSRHDWPHDFYANTVSGTQNGSEGLGFPLSKEGGGWDNQGNYTMGQAPRFLGENRTRTELNPLIANLGSKLAVGALDRATSLTGTVLVFDYGASLVSGSPVWLSVAVTVTNPVNFVSLQAAFTSGNTAEGLLSVYWNTNQIGTIDERLISPGFRDYTFALPGTITNGVYALGFRLDPFTAAISSVTVTNITLGISGVTDPIRLSIVKETNASPTVLLTAPAGFTYLVESSTNLVDWTPLAALVNTNGAVQFVDPNASNFPRHFYRAVLP
jgi:hypothetical protein